MDTRFDEHDAGLLILEADLDLNESPAETFVQQVESMIDDGVNRMIIDCGRLEYVSSYGLSALVRFRNRLKPNEGEVKLCCVVPDVEQLLELTSLDRLFQTYPNLDEARAAFQAVT